MGATGISARASASTNGMTVLSTLPTHHYQITDRQLNPALLPPCGTTHHDALIDSPDCAQQCADKATRP